MSERTTSRVFALVLICILVCMSTVTVSADDLNDEPLYRWNNVTSIEWSKQIVGSQLKFTIKITGKSGTTYSNGTMVLKNSSNTQIASWSGISSTSSSFTINNYLSYIPSSGTYTATLTITAKRNGTSETITSTYTFTI